jgi:hypothetical protein
MTHIRKYGHELINKTANVMQLGAIVFMIPWKALYMFQVLFTPVIRGVLKLYMQFHLLSHTNKCTNYIIYYSKSVSITDIKTLSNFHSSYTFRHITCHPQGALMFLAKITGKTIYVHFLQIVLQVILDRNMSAP